MGQKNSAISPKLLSRRSDVSADRRIEDVCDIDKNMGPLGKGAFGTVWRAHLRDKRASTVAVKTLDKTLIQQKGFPPSQVFSEVELMQNFTGKGQFVQLYEFIDTPDTFFLIMEYCDGGDLVNAVIESEGNLGDGQVMRFMKQMIKAIEYLHTNSICHRDIKPPNFMIVGKPSSEQVKVKLGDFGLAVHLHGHLRRDKVGTPAFMAPEMHYLPAKSTGYDQKVDIWAMGVVMIYLLAHQYSFIDSTGHFMYDQLLHGNMPLWDRRFFSGLFQNPQEATAMRGRRPSSATRYLVRKLLVPKREQRVTAEAALRHEWFKQPAQSADQYDWGDNSPILVWEEFEEGLSNIERERKTSLRAELERERKTSLRTELEKNAHKSRSCANIPISPPSPLRAVAYTPQWKSENEAPAAAAWAWSSGPTNENTVMEPCSWPHAKTVMRRPGEMQGSMTMLPSDIVDASDA